VSTPSTPAPSATPPTSEDARRKRLLSYSSKNMIYSMLAVLVVAFAWWSLMPNPDEPQRRPAEVEQAAGFAAREADWPVWSPVGLPETWSGTSVSYATIDGVPTWRMGWVSPQTEYVALRQTVDPPESWSGEVLRDLEQQGPVALQGPAGEQDWDVYTGVDRNGVPEVALVLAPTPDQPATTIVHGTADVPEIAVFVEALEVAEP
jgi:hypothetical protein